jgi:spore germination cell wall hydrolase CwlJ-like protein
MRYGEGGYPMERVYRNTDEIVDKMKVVPVFDRSGLSLDVYLDGRKVGRIDKHNKEIRVKVKVADEEKAALEETNSDIKELARLVYAEAAGEHDIHNAMEGVAWVVRNRVEANRSWFGGNTYNGVIHKTGQFTSIGTSRWNEAGDPETLSGPALTAYKRALTVARGVYKGTISDPTDGAHYFHSYAKQFYGWFDTAYANGRITPAKPDKIGPFWFFKLK